MRTPLIAALLLLLLPAARAAGIANPSFEINTTDGGSTYQPLYDGFAGLPGWRFSPAPAPVLIGTPDDDYPYATPYGRWQLDLSGSDNSTGAWIETDLTGLLPGRTYRLGFSLGASVAFLAEAGGPAVSVRVGGTQMTVSASPTAIIEWTDHGMQFEAGAASVAVRFENVSPTGTGLVSVDNLTLAEVAAAPFAAFRAGPDGRLRLEFQGRLESSSDLRSWSPEPGITSGTVLETGAAPRFFRAVAD